MSAKNRKKIAAVMLSVCCLIGASAASAIGQSASSKESKTKDVQPPGDKKAVSFQELNWKEPIELRRTSSECKIDFPVPRTWQAKSGSTLVINLAHSPSLVARLSSLTVTINGVVLKTIGLDASSVSPCDVVIPIDQVHLKDFNRLTLKVVQHYSQDCEDEFSSSLWTVINSSSHFIFSGEEQDAELNLQNWPYPFLDEQAVGRHKVYFAPLKSANVESLRSLARLAINLGALSQYHQVDLAYGNAPNGKGNIVAVGMPSENALTTGLSDKLPIPIKSGKFVDETGKVLADDTGVLELVKSTSGSTVLIVGGNSAVAVEKATRALVRGDFNPIIGGSAALVEEISGENLAPPIARAGQIPREKSFALADLGYITSTVHGVDPPPLTVQANGLPGIQAIGSSQSLHVVFGYGAQLNTELSSFEIRMNGITLRSYGLIKPEGEERHEDIVEIRNSLFKNENKFEFLFHLYPKNVDKCSSRIDQQLWGTLYDGTRLNLDHEYVTGLPNLNLLNNFGFPFAKTADLHDLTIVLPASANDQAISALASISYLLGQWTENADGKIAIARADTVDDTARKGNIIVLSPGAANAMQAALGGALALNDSDKSVRKLNASNKRSFIVREVDPDGYIEECVNPWNAEKSVLVVSGATPESFALAMNGICDSDLRFKLAGSLASVSPERIVKSIQATPIVESTTMTQWRRITLALSEHVWWSPLAVLLLLAFLLPRLLKAVKPKPEQAATTTSAPKDPAE